MKTIGKIAALAMTLSLAFVMTACGGGASSSAASSAASASAASASASAAASEASAPASAASAAASSAASAASAAASEAASSAASAAASEAASASAAASDTAAAADADTYVNEYFGIKYVLPEGWKMTDPSTLQDLNSVITAASANASLDMVATNAEGNQVVLVGIEEASSATAGMSAEQYLEAQKTQMEESLQGNYSWSSVSASITFEGTDRELPAAVTTLDLNGTQLCFCEAVAEKDGNFFEAIAIGATQDEVTSAFEAFRSTTAA